MLAHLRARLQRWAAAILPPPTVPVPVVLETERLRLRELEETDFAAIYAYRSDPEVMQYLTEGGPVSEEVVQATLDLTRRFAAQRERESYCLGIVLRETDLLIGEAFLRILYPLHPTAPPRTATVGFVLDRNHWGQGYATETAGALLHYALETLDLPCVYAGCLPENTASLRVLEKAGMTLLGSQFDFPGAPYGAEALVCCITQEEMRTA